MVVAMVVATVVGGSGGTSVQNILQPLGWEYENKRAGTFSLLKPNPDVS